MLRVWCVCVCVCGVCVCVWCVCGVCVWCVCGVWCVWCVWCVCVCVFRTYSVTTEPFCMVSLQYGTIITSNALSSILPRSTIVL